MKPKIGKFCLKTRQFFFPPIPSPNKSGQTMFNCVRWRVYLGNPTCGALRLSKPKSHSLITDDCARFFAAIY